MSETEHQVGTLKPTNKTVEQYCGGVDLTDSWADDIQEYFTDKYYRKAYVIDNMVYEVECKDFGEEDIFTAVKNGDNIDFVVKFYNGGCSFDEALEQAIENLNKEENK